MTNQILSNVKMYLTERQKQVTEMYECTNADYYEGKLDGLDELINFITGEEMHLTIDSIEKYSA